MNVGVMTPKGQITVPKELRDKLGLKSGDMFTWHFENGSVVIRRRNRPIMDLSGLLHDPDRIPLSDKELEEAIGNSVAQR